MDIRCPRCGEPWDIDSLHEEVKVRYPNKPWVVLGEYTQWVYEKYFKEVTTDFNKRGCIALCGEQCYKSDNHYSELAAVINEVMGDDIDGVAEMWNDAERYGLI